MKARTVALPAVQGVELQAKLFRGFADSSRLALLLALREGRLSVGELCRRTGLAQSNASNHLGCLRECGLVRTEQEGRFVYYELADPRVGKLLTTAGELLADVAEGLYDCTRYCAKPGSRDD